MHCSELNFEKKIYTPPYQLLEKSNLESSNHPTIQSSDHDLRIPPKLGRNFQHLSGFRVFLSRQDGCRTPLLLSCREPSRPFGNRKSHRKTTTIIICSLQQIYPLLSGLNIEPLTSSERYPKPLQNSCNQPSYFLSYPNHCCNVMWEKHVCRYRKKW